MLTPGSPSGQRYVADPLGADGYLNDCWLLRVIGWIPYEQDELAVSGVAGAEHRCHKTEYIFSHARDPHFITRREMPDTA